MAFRGRNRSQGLGIRVRSWFFHVGLLLTTVLTLLLGCSEEGTAPRIEKTNSGPDQVIWDFTTTDSDSGQLLWILRADQALVYRKAKRVQSVGVSVDMYGGDEGRLNSTLTADSGLFDRRSGAMTATGNVRVHSREGYELETEILHWDRDRELFHTEAYVEVRQGENLYSGYDMECDQNLDRLHIRREPRGVIVREESEDG
jgi:LPS export ABC transporter protein LptC